MLPTALMKQTGDLYSCAAFNVPEKLRFGNLFNESARGILERVDRSDALARITGQTPEFCSDLSLHLNTDLGPDSLSLLELVTSLEKRLGVTVPDEDTGQVQTAGDLLAVLERLSCASTLRQTMASRGNHT